MVMDFLNLTRRYPYPYTELVERIPESNTLQTTPNRNKVSASTRTGVSLCERHSVTGVFQKSKLEV